MNRFSLIFLCMLATAHIACPMAGNTLSWPQRIKNSLSSIYSKALSYCSLKKQPQSLTRNAQVSAMLACQTHEAQKRHEQIRMIPWATSLKNVPCKQTNPHEDDIQNPIYIKKDIPLFKKPAHLLSFNDPRMGKAFADINAKRYAPMLEATDCIITNHLGADETPIKHAGLSIIKRSDELYKEHKLACYRHDKNAPINKIVINGSCKNVNQMIVRQHEKNLARPTLYVTLKDTDGKTLENSKVDFTFHKGNQLFVKISDATAYDIELHLPQNISKIPEIIYITPQVKTAQVIVL